MSHAVRIGLKARCPAADPGLIGARSAMIFIGSPSFFHIVSTPSPLARGSEWENPILGLGQRATLDRRLSGVPASLLVASTIKSILLHGARLILFRGRGDTSMDASTVGTVASAVAAALALIFGFYQYHERRRQQLLIDLQGNKETVAAVATRVRNGKLPWRWRYHRELLEAMCLATVFERSGRSRSLLYAALAKSMAKKRSRKMITSSVEDISAVIARNSPYTDLARARRHLFALRAALSINDDIRIRAERIDTYLSQPDARKKYDNRCRDEIHEWGALKDILEQRESVVLVCPKRVDGDVPGCPTIALDFHMTARLPKDTAQVPALRQPSTETSDSATTHCQHDPSPTSRHETFQLTELGQRLRSAKYCGSTADRDLIADELASLIVYHPAYAAIRVIAVVPASKHGFSNQLGEQVARRVSERLNVSMKCVQIARKASTNVQATGNDDANAEPGFALTDPDAVKGADVILVDDVYRAGDTLRAATQVLKNAEAKKIFGLTATCTVSAIAPHCG